MAVVASAAATTSTQAGLDTANLHIDDIISHRVFARDASKIARDPVLADALMTLPREGLDAIQQRLTSALGSRSHGIEMSIEKTEADSSKVGYCTGEHQWFVWCPDCAARQDREAARPILGGNQSRSA